MIYVIGLIRLLFLLIYKLDNKVNTLINISKLQNIKSDMYDDKFEVTIKNLECKIYELEEKLKNYEMED